MKTIYLANPYGFSASQRALLLPPIKWALESLGLEVWEPFERNSQVDWEKGDAPFLVGLREKADVEDAHALFAVCNGVPPDEGVMIELGMAIALGKRTFLFRDDFRHCTDSSMYPLNLMLFTGLPKDEWRDYFHESVASITDPRKALARWAKQ